MRRRRAQGHPFFYSTVLQVPQIKQVLIRRYPQQIHAYIVERRRVGQFYESGKQPLHDLTESVRNLDLFLVC